MTTYNDAYNDARQNATEIIERFKAHIESATVADLKIAAEVNGISLKGKSGLRKAELKAYLVSEFTARQYMMAEEMVDTMYEKGCFQADEADEADEAIANLQEELAQCPSDELSDEFDADAADDLFADPQATEFGPEACEEEPVDYELTEAVNDEDFYSTKAATVAARDWVAETFQQLSVSAVRSFRDLADAATMPRRKPVGFAVA